MTVLRVDRDGPIATLTIDRPAVHNALNRDVLDGLRSAVRRADDDPATRVLVVTGAGERAFSAGADLDELAALSVTQAHAVLQSGSRTMRAIETSRVPVIAAVNGFALGGGFELALACTFITFQARSAL